jgi:FkbM family methyltransferase
MSPGTGGVARALRRVARRLGLVVSRVDTGCWVVQRSRRTERRELLRVGERDLGTHVLVDRRRARRHPGGFQRRMSELLLQEEVAWLLAATDANVVLDVGANVGQYATMLRRAGYRGRIVSFEPVREPFERLRRAAAGDPEWHVHHYALGSSEGTAEINAVPGTLSSMLPASDFGKQWNERLTRTTTESITVRRLDAVFDEVTAGLDPVRGYLKLDTQGFDLEVFEGGRPVLDRVVGFQSEVACVPIYDGMPPLPEAVSRYESEGFAVAGMYSVTRDPATLRVIEFDLVMVRPDAIGQRPGTASVPGSAG